MITIELPTGGDRLERYRLGEPRTWARPTAPITSRTAYAAAHVVALATADNTPGAPAELDWDATLADALGGAIACGAGTDQLDPADLKAGSAAAAGMRAYLAVNGVSA